MPSVAEKKKILNMKQAIYKNKGVIFLIPKKCLTEEVYDKA